MGIQGHGAPVRHYYCFGPKLERRFTKHNYFERLFKRLAINSCLGCFRINHNLDFLSDCCGQNVARIEQLHICDAGEWKENLLIKLYIDVVKQVIPCKVENHTNRGQRDTGWSKLKGHLNDWTVLVKVFKLIQRVILILFAVTFLT